MGRGCFNREIEKTRMSDTNTKIRYENQSRIRTRLPLNTTPGISRSIGISNLQRLNPLPRNKLNSIFRTQTMHGRSTLSLHLAEGLARFVRTAGLKLLVFVHTRFDLAIGVPWDHLRIRPCLVFGSLARAYPQLELIQHDVTTTTCNKLHTRYKAEV